MTFGRQENIINTLTFTLLEVLKSGTESDKEKIIQTLKSFLGFFKCAAVEYFFGCAEIGDDDLDQKLIV